MELISESSGKGLPPPTVAVESHFQEAMDTLQASHWLRKHFVSLPCSLPCISLRYVPGLIRVISFKEDHMRFP